MAAGSLDRSCTKWRSMLPQSILYCLKELRYFSCTPHFQCQRDLKSGTRISSHHNNLPQRAVGV